MNSTLALPDQVVENWHLVKDLLKQAIDHGAGESTLTDYLKRILNYQAQLWVFTDDGYNVKGVGLTKFIEYSTHRTLHIVAVAGVDWNEWADQYYVVEKFTKENNCKAAVS